MDIEFIKWLCEKARGFRHIEKMYDIECPDGMYIAEGLIERHRMRWPLLLQRAIENIQQDRCVDGVFPLWWIKQANTTIHVRNDNMGVNKVFLSEGQIDQAKEEVLKYIYEQENDND